MDVKQFVEILKQTGGRYRHTNFLMEIFVATFSPVNRKGTDLQEEVVSLFYNGIANDT